MRLRHAGGPSTAAARFGEAARSIEPQGVARRGQLRAPELSIGVPVYNGARYVSEAIECVLSQACDFEVIRRGTSCSGSGVGLSPATGHRSRIR
jgi:hypothetical protein